MLCVLLLDLLFLLLCVTGSVYWLGTVTYEQAAEAGMAVCRGCALRQLSVFLAATAACLLYCETDWPFSRFGGEQRDALVFGGVIGCACLLVSRIRLRSVRKKVQ